MNTFELRLLHFAPDLVAIDKPAGLLVHPSALDAHEDHNALHLLRDQLGERLWPLHRLDKGTSGVLLFGRNVEAARRWGSAFEQGLVRKRYLALVRGWPPEAGEIDQPLARDPELPSAGQPRLAAVTRYRRLACLEWPFGDGRHPTSRYALVEAEPLSGRRHQIRRHFKHIAHPLVGDATHGKGNNWGRIPNSWARVRASTPAHCAGTKLESDPNYFRWLGVQRLWLHASWVELPQDGPPLRIEAPAGPEWNALLQHAR